MVTLRGERMWDFIDRLVSIALPRVRDFRGLNPKSFDGRGNYTLGLKENVAFPEVKVEEIDKIHGLQMIFVTNAKDRKAGKILLQKMGFPFAQ